MKGRTNPNVQLICCSTPRMEGGLDVCVDLTCSSTLTQTRMVDFVSRRVVIEAAQRKRVKYEAKGKVNLGIRNCVDHSTCLNPLIQGPVGHPNASDSSSAKSSPRREIEKGCQVHLSLTRLDNNYFGIYLEEALDRAGLRCNTGTPPRETRASVIVLTEAHVTFSPSLDRLLESLEERRNSNHFVLPVFYHIESSYIIEHGKNLMLESFRGSGTLLEKVDQWHAALTEVANIPGISVSRWSKKDGDMAGIREIVAEGGGGRLVVGGEDGGGEVVILASC
nr:hypothetical protein [Tanacetum cinerariifolium]